MTLEELYEKLTANEELCRELTETVDSEETLVAFLRKNNCDATWEEYKAFMEEKRAARRELGEDELSQVAGGAPTWVGSLIIWWGCAAASIAIEYGTEDDCIESLT